MNKIITSIGLVNTNNMQRISITYSIVDDNGTIVEDNRRVNKVVVDDNVNDIVSQIYQHAQNIVNVEE